MNSQDTFCTTHNEWFQDLFSNGDYICELCFLDSCGQDRCESKEVEYDSFS